jgi:hypothetical protein
VSHLPHTSAHFFNCPIHVTDLVRLDMWKQTRKVAVFLKSLPSFVHLPSVTPLPPNFQLRIPRQQQQQQQQQPIEVYLDPKE